MIKCQDLQHLPSNLCIPRELTVFYRSIGLKTNIYNRSRFTWSEMK